MPSMSQCIAAHTPWVIDTSKFTLIQDSRFLSQGTIRYVQLAQHQQRFTQTVWRPFRLGISCQGACPKPPDRPYQDRKSPERGKPLSSLAEGYRKDDLSEPLDQGHERLLGAEAPPLAINMRLPASHRGLSGERARLP